MDIDFVNKRGLDLSKEVLWVCVGQRAAVLWAVKVGGKKKYSANQPNVGTAGSNLGDWQIFFGSPTLIARKTAIL